MNRQKLDKSLHWTTFYSEKLLLAVIGALTMFAAGMDVLEMILAMKVELGDLFLLFIYAEIVGMVGAFYISNRIPVTLPIIIAMTALCRLIVLHSKEADPWRLGRPLSRNRFDRRSRCYCSTSRRGLCDEP